MVNQIGVRKTAGKKSFACTLCLLKYNDNNDDNAANGTITTNFFISVSLGGRNKYAFLESIFVVVVFIACYVLLRTTILH